MPDRPGGRVDDPVRLLVAGAMLFGATVSDLRTRRVPNRFWWPWLAAALVLLAGDALAGRAMLAPLAWALGTLAFLYGLWYLGLFGGADAKGLMVLALLWPAVPELLAGRTTPTLDALVNASAFVAVLPLLFVAWNLARGDVAAPMFIAVRMDREAARRRHVWPLERVHDDGGVRIRVWQRIGEPLDDAYARLEAARVERVWATPKVPFMLALLPGLVVADRWGNLLLRLVARLAS